jgi:hypothetical protein
MRASNTSAPGCAGRGGRSSDNRGRGGPYIRAVTLKLIPTLAVQGALRIRGGAPVDMDLSDNQDGEDVAPPSRFNYKGDPPWASPPAVEADPTVFHAAVIPNAPPKVRHFVGTINLSFTVTETKRGNSNVSILLKRFVPFVKQTDPDFRIKPLNGSDQCITNPSNIPTS